MPYHRSDPFCNGKGLQLSLILRYFFILIFQQRTVFIHKKDLCFYKFRILAFWKRSSGIQSCRLVVGNSSQIFPHDLPENKIDTFKDFRSASEIFVQVDPLFLTVFQRIALIFFHEQFRTGQTKTVDALLYISYHKDIFTFIDPAGNCLHQDLLDQITVLILIQQDLIIFFRKLSCRLAGHIVFSFLFQKDIQGKMFHIRKIQNIFFTLLCLETLCKILCQLHQHLQRWCRCFCQFRQLSQISVKISDSQFLQIIFCIFAKSFYQIFQLLRYSLHFF